MLLVLILECIKAYLYMMYIMPRQDLKMYKIGKERDPQAQAVDSSLEAQMMCVGDYELESSIY
jgi:hypothetical protein